MTKCECGETSGFRCDAVAEKVIEWMPPQHRASHRAAGNSGRYPMNGAVRLNVSADCARRVIDADGDWTSEVS